MLWLHCSSFEWTVTSQFKAYDSTSQHLLNWLANLSSDTDVTLVAWVAARFAGTRPPNAILNFYFTGMVQFWMTSWILMGDECRSSVVQGLLELPSDCSSDLASSSNVVSDISTLADLQFGHPNSISYENKIALLSIVETSLMLKPLLGIFPSWHLVIRGFLQLTNTRFGLAGAVQIQWWQRLVHEWNWWSCITHCQYAQAVFSIHQFYAQ